MEIDARRVVVHPAFEDTTFACRAIQIDRFVDSFLYSDEYSSSKTQQIQAVRSGVTSAGVLLEYLGRASYSSERQEVVDYLIENAGIDIFDRVKFVSGLVVILMSVSRLHYMSPLVFNMVVSPSLPNA